VKIALLTNGIFPYAVGGIQKHSYYLAKYLIKEGASIDLHCGLCPNIATTDDIVRLFTTEERSKLRVYVSHHPSIRRYPGHYLRSSYLISKSIYKSLCDNPDVDFVYAQGFTGWKTIMDGRKKSSLPPVGVNFHGLNMFQPSIGRNRLHFALFRPIVKRILRRSEFVLSLGGGLTEIICDIGIPSEKVIESPNGVTEDWLVPYIRTSSGPRTFIFVGRYHRLKGVEELNEAISTLLLSNKFKFHFIGPIPRHLKIKSEKVKYWGLLKDENTIRNIMRESDILVCPSLSEGVPTVILEAMASGLAVIGTNVGAVDSLVSKENGWIVQPQDVSNLVKALKEGITISDVEMSKRKKSSLELVSNKYLWRMVAKTTLAAIKKAIS